MTALDATEGDVIAADVANPEELVLETERTRYVTAAVRSLPERMRYIVEQIYFHDRAVGDLATELGLTHSAVSQQRTEAMRLLRDGFGTHYADDPAVEYTPESRTAPARRAAYLARMAESTMAGMARALQPAVLAHTGAAS